MDTERNPDRRLLLAKCANVLGVSAISEENNFFQLGGDSLQAVEISEVLSAEYGREAPIELILGAETFGDLLAALEGSNCPA
jgi:nonribosomal peptide synthetase MxcG